MKLGCVVFTMLLLGVHTKQKKKDGHNTGKTEKDKGPSLSSVFNVLNVNSQNNSKTSKEGTLTIDDVCAEIAKFAPNMCIYRMAREQCRSICAQKDGNAETLHCGKRPLLPSRNKKRVRRIVGGVPSVKGEWPWQCNLRNRNVTSNETVQLCAGSILSENFIITTAHCFDKLVIKSTFDQWQVVVGDHHMTDNESDEQRVGIKQVIQHPDYNVKYVEPHGKKGEYTIIENDIAIIQLKSPLKLDETLKITGSICLPDDNKKIPDMFSCYVTGWGHASFEDKKALDLHHTKVLTIPTAICNLQTSYDNNIDGDKSVCAGFQESGIDVCNYDSGGPMACKKDGLWYVTGLISSGYNCGEPEGYGIYTNVPKYKEWVIESILSKAKVS